MCYAHSDDRKIIYRSGRFLCDNAGKYSIYIYIDLHCKYIQNSSVEPALEHPAIGDSILRRTQPVTDLQLRTTTETSKTMTTATERSGHKSNLQHQQLRQQHGKRQSKSRRMPGKDNMNNPFFETLVQGSSRVLLACPDHRYRDGFRPSSHCHLHRRCCLEQ